MSTPNQVRYVCAGCGASVDPALEHPFRCPNAGDDDVDHVMVRDAALEDAPFPPAVHEHPFIRYRTLLPSYCLARTGGMTDDDFVARVAAIDARLATVDGHGFVCTPLVTGERVLDQLAVATGGSLWIKNETDNVAGSHKARHLMEVALYLDVLEQLDPSRRALHDARGLTIASCGNAALAAAVLASATQRPLTVFVPTDAPPDVLSRIRALGARIVECARRPGEAGDPSFLAFRRAREAGAIPFCCQGSENGMNIDGGKTLAYEIVSSLQTTGGAVDRLFIQVGGGALASACVQGLRDAVVLGALPRLPRIHAVQTENVSPLPRAYERVRSMVVARLGGTSAQSATSLEHTAELAERMCTAEAAGHVREVLRYAQTRRAEFMWPWEQTPRSVARGILDDETYDWHAVVSGMIESGGFPLTVAESGLSRAHAVAHDASGIPVCATGTSGLAGLVELRTRADKIVLGNAVVLFTGAERTVTGDASTSR